MDYIERNRDFKGVWIPKDIWLNENLTMLEKVILIEIDSLDNEEHCIAGNDYLSQFCQCSEWKVSTAIKKLQELGYIEIVSFDGRHRKIKSCLLKSQEQTLENPKADSGKPKAINIDNNLTTKIDNDIYTSEGTSPSESYNSQVKEIIDYLNQKAKTRYRANSENTKKHIVARLNQQYTIDDFKHVIDVKCAEWLNTDMEKYLRPDTLFGTKFDYYLQQKITASKPTPKVETSATPEKSSSTPRDNWERWERAKKSIDFTTPF
ncbi:MAG: conserved phage C-terminal domain-containing protein [Paludibacteraceae bacterium]|nr:conserved phage C-terminal domain-containing protein [Paludibacteraceae bacterium]